MAQLYSLFSFTQSLSLSHTHTHTRARYLSVFKLSQFCARALVCVCVRVSLLPAHLLNKGHSCCRFALNKRWQSRNIWRLAANETMILSNLNSDISCITSTPRVNCDMIMFATEWELFSSAQRDSLTPSLPHPSLFCSLTPPLPSLAHICSGPPSVSNTNSRTRTHARGRHVEAYGYSSPLWRVALKLWHPYRLALRWARSARALRLSVALFQTERERGWWLGGLHTHHSLTLSHSQVFFLNTHTLRARTRTHAQTGG